MDFRSFWPFELKGKEDNVKLVCEIIQSYLEITICIITVSMIVHPAPHSDTFYFSSFMKMRHRFETPSYMGIPIRKMNVCSVYNEGLRYYNLEFEKFYRRKWRFDFHFCLSSRSSMESSPKKWGWSHECALLRFLYLTRSILVPFANISILLHLLRKIRVTKWNIFHLRIHQSFRSIVIPENENIRLTKSKTDKTTGFIIK